MDVVVHGTGHDPSGDESASDGDGDGQKQIDASAEHLDKEKARKARREASAMRKAAGEPPRRPKAKNWKGLLTWPHETPDERTKRGEEWPGIREELLRSGADAEDIGNVEWLSDKLMDEVHVNYKDVVELALALKPILLLAPFLKLLTLPRRINIMGRDRWPALYNGISEAEKKEMVNMKAMLGKRSYCGQGEERDAHLKTKIGKKTSKTGAERSYLAAINKANWDVPNFTRVTSIGEVRARGLTTMTTCIGIEDQQKQEYELYQRLSYFKAERDAVKIDFSAHLRRNAKCQADQARRCTELVRQHGVLQAELDAA